MKQSNDYYLYEIGMRRGILIKNEIRQKPLETKHGFFDRDKGCIVSVLIFDVCLFICLVIFLFAFYFSQ